MPPVEGISGIELQALYGYILQVLVSSLRVGAFLISSPFFGSRMIPLQVRIVFSVALGIGIMGHVEPPSPSVLASTQILPIVFQEIFLGLVCGMIFSILFATVQLAGEKIATTSGLAFASQVDPSSGGQSPVISQIFSLFLLIIFFSLNGHVVVFRYFFQSFDAIPFGEFRDFKATIEVGLSASGLLYEKAVILALPIVGLLFFMNVGIGFITKSAPQLNLFSFGFPLTILGTFFALYFSVDALQFVFSEIIDEAIGYLKLVLQVQNNG